jgi:hypothetical protein
MFWAIFIPIQEIGLINSAKKSSDSSSTNGIYKAAGQSVNANLW